jgi:hypothetical protein
MFIPVPDFYPSRIPDPTTATKEGGGGEKKFVVKAFFVATNLSISSKKNGFGIRDPEKISSGSRIRVQGSKRHRIQDPDTQH